MHPEELAEYYLLALCIWREARGEPMLGKLYVAQTIKNRVKDSRWPDTYTDVILQPLQFSAFNKNDIQVSMYPKPEDNNWADCVAAADMVLDCKEDFIKANHYHARSVKPKWAKQEYIVAQIGNHIFYNLP